MSRLNMINLVHRACNIEPTNCEICGAELTDENRSQKYEAGCVDCDHEQYEPRHYEDPTDHYEERR